MRVATFNVQNLRLRRRDGRRILDGASDDDTPEPASSDTLAFADRVKTARIIAAAGADVVALQEVFDLETLDFFNDRFLIPAGAKDYRHRYCIKGNDGRGLNVAALSRFAAKQVQSHAEKSGAELGLTDLSKELRDLPLFRRDCLEIDLDTAVLFICHFKAPYPDVEKALRVRCAEAQAVRRLVEDRFPDPESRRWIVLGDFNEPAPYECQSGSALAVFGDGFAVDLLDRLPKGRDWTYELPESHLHTRPDRILASPALAREFPDVRPRIIRSGMNSERLETGGGSGGWHPRASDHALVYADFPGL